MYRRTFAILICLLALGGLVVGCGGDSDGGDGGGDAPTKAEFVKEAEAKCKEIYKEVQKQLAAAARSLRANPSDEKGQEELLINTIILPTLQKQHDLIEELGAPDGDEERVDAILAALQKLEKEAEANPIGVLARTDPFREVDQLMKDYGIEACRH